MTSNFPKAVIHVFNSGEMQTSQDLPKRQLAIRKPQPLPFYVMKSDFCIVTYGGTESNGKAGDVIVLEGFNTWSIYSPEDFYRQFDIVKLD